MKKGLLFIVLLCLLLPLQIKVKALTTTSLSIVSVQDNTGDCGQTINGLQVMVEVGEVTGATSNPTGQDDFAVVIFDGDGNYVAVAFFAAQDGISWTPSPPAIPATNFNVAGITPPTSYLFQAVLIDLPDAIGVNIQAYLGNKPLVSTGWFDASSLSPACDALPQSSAPSTVAMPPDDRINWQFGDANVGILYPGRDGALNLYIYETEQYIFDFITPTELEIYAEVPPNANRLIKQLGQITVYVLTTGQIQFNFGPDREGKIWVLVLDDLADHDTSASYYLDPNE